MSNHRGDQRIMRVKTYSDVSLTSGLSPSQTPGEDGRGQVYYVQSPSPYGESGMLSPMRSTSPLANYNHSRSTSLPEKAWFSGPPAPAGKVVTSSSPQRQKGYDQYGPKDHRFEAIREDDNLLWDEKEEEEDKDERFARRCRYGICFVVGFFLLFTFFSLVLWGASRNQKPIITMKTIRFENFDVQAGVDHAGVSTTMTTMNATVRLVYRNTGSFFGIHVAPTVLNLFYQRLMIASGTSDRFYQGRKSQRALAVRVGGESVPMYGGGSTLASKDSAPTLPVNFTFDFNVRSRAYVLGKLVKPKFVRTVFCNVTMDPKKMNKLLPLKNLCVYH